MNSLDGVCSVKAHLFRLFLKSRTLLWKAKCNVFSSTKQDAIQAIFLINLDRHPKRLNDVHRELSQVLTADGQPISSLIRRFSAIDANENHLSYTTLELEPYYSLADQLFVEPDDRIPLDIIESNQHIAMSKQEVAIALSHINVWKQIANGDSSFALVLEDDIYLIPGFSKYLSKAWNDAGAAFDVLYLSYLRGRSGIRINGEYGNVFRIAGGLWQLSGYVVSKKGAQRLLDQLPVRGPVDLWINLQFSTLNVFSTKRPIIRQRPDNVSSNSYSILPVLSKTGLLETGPALFENRELLSPVFGFGLPTTGQTSLAMAMSILGYRCCSDIDELGEPESSKLFEIRGKRIFDSYVNIGSLTPESLVELADIYPDSKFVFTSDGSESEDWNVVADHLAEQPNRFIELQEGATNKWKLLCEFLHCNLPVCDFPLCEDIGHRSTTSLSKVDSGKKTKLRFDRSPWVVSDPNWNGIQVVNEKESEFEDAVVCSFDSKETIGNDWSLLNETFPGNLAFFRPENFTVVDGQARICVKESNILIRDYSSASFSSQKQFLYGQFTVRLKCPKLSGIVTGVFLHRNSPRHEIDIEILGKDPTKMLTNVFYNPGVDGTKYDYGFRGTPILIDLGFDASEDFHDYTIVWTQESIRFVVDGQLVHERVCWEPTPIPNLGMHFYVNCWPSNSTEFAGVFQNSGLPVSCLIDEIHVQSVRKSSSKVGKLC